MPTCFRSVRLISVFCVLLAGAPLAAKTREFGFKDPKGVNAVAFMLDSVLEPIVGVASGVSGTVAFDPARPEKTRGEIIVEAKSLDTPNFGMKRALHSPEWLDVHQFPNIKFAMEKVESVESAGKGVWSTVVSGPFSCHGVTRNVSVPVTVTYLPDRLSDRMGGNRQGDLLVLRSNFTIRRSDFDIKKDSGGELVAEEIEIRVSIVGAAPKE